MSGGRWFTAVIRQDHPATTLPPVRLRGVMTRDRRAHCRVCHVTFEVLFDWPTPFRAKPEMPMLDEQIGLLVP
jgi:hypothetical protein